jgi:hypothetical protein
MFGYCGLRYAALIEQKMTLWFLPSGRPGVRLYSLYAAVALLLVLFFLSGSYYGSMAYVFVFMLPCLFISWAGMFIVPPQRRRPIGNTWRSRLRWRLDKSNRIYRIIRFRRSLQIISILGSFTMAMWFYADVIYPRLPQEYGGTRPRYALVDLLRDGLSKDTLEALASGDSVSSTSTVVRSKPLAVFYFNTELMLVKPVGARSSTTFDLRKSAIKAVTWRAITLTRLGDTS